MAEGMARVRRPSEGDEAGLRRAAALRLKHDLGKYIRWNAPGVGAERDPEALRARLKADLMETRKSPAGTKSAAEIFDEWERENGGLFFLEDENLRALRAAMVTIRVLGPALSTLEEKRLYELDQASLEVALGCSALCSKYLRLSSSCLDES